VFDATLAEQLALWRGDAGPAKDELAERNEWRKTASADIAPQYIGGTPGEPPPADWYPEPARRGIRATEAVLRCLFKETSHAPEPNLVRGLNASAGVYEGRARLVLRPEHFPRIEQGDVLIARCTTEAYNGIIPLLGAVVTDRGGVLSHAATVAREFGIPAVVGTQTATQTIPDGARVRVDGTRGEARLL
jgi:pyruvate,water dikinase